MSITASTASAIVGAPGSHSGSGGAYVFVRSGSTWSQQVKLLAKDAAIGAGFGRSVSIDSDLAVVGADREDSNEGAAYAFSRSGAIWQQQQWKIVAPARVAGDAFGAAVAIRGGLAVVGAAGVDREVGRAFSYAPITTGLSPTSMYATDSEIIDGFGFAIAYDGDTAISARRITTERSRRLRLRALREQLDPAGQVARVRWGAERQLRHLGIVER